MQRKADHFSRYLHCSIQHVEVSRLSRYTLETIVVILIILWLLGWLAFPVGGNLIHILLVVILIIVVIRLVRGQPAI